MYFFDSLTIEDSVLQEEWQWKYRKNQNKRSCTLNKLDKMLTYFQSKSTVRCLHPEEEFTCSTDLRGIITCFLRFLFY